MGPFRNQARIAMAIAGPKPFDRKQQLITESGRLRAAVSHQMDQIEASLGWVNRGVSLGHQVRKGGLIVTAASGLFLAWKLFKGKPEPVEETAPAVESSLLSKVAHHGFQLAGVVGPVLWKLLRG